MMKYLIPILAVSALCAGWVVVQLLAKKMKTKNHFDNLGGEGSCMSCTCGGVEESCTNEKKS